MRLIDADALIKKIRNFVDTMSVCTSTDYCNGLRFMKKQAIEAVEKAPTVEPSSPWHRVEDGLPEKDEWVLTITKSYKGARIYNISTVDSDGRWWTTSQNGMREIHYIEYWMPIEPPKEDE